MTIHVAVTSDENYVIPLAACVRSVFDNATADADVDVSVLSCGISAGSRALLRSSWGADADRVTWLEIDEARLSHLPTKSKASRHLTPATYARLLLPDVLPRDSRRVLFLDTDSVTTGSLLELWQSSLDGLPFAAVRDPYTPVLSSRHGVRAWRELGLDPQAPYFNAGVILMDVDQWRDERISERALQYVVERQDEILLADQEGMNVVANGRFVALDPKWNVMNYWHMPSLQRDPPPREVMAGVVERVRVRHFNGPVKPWTPEPCYLRGRSPAAPVRGAVMHRQPKDFHLFFRYLDRTAWRGWRPHVPVAA